MTTADLPVTPTPETSPQPRPRRAARRAPSDADERPRAETAPGEPPPSFAASEPPSLPETVEGDEAEGDDAPAEPVGAHMSVEVGAHVGGEATPGPLRLPSVTDVWRAQEALRPHVYHTPLLPSRTVSALSGAEVYFKTENLQRAGSYKIRGATYKLSRLSSAERARGVIAASAGNHAQGVAMAARALGVPCTIVMPATAPLAKVTATQGYGAQVALHGATFNDAYDRALALQAETGAVLIHAYDDPDIIAGQGTVGLEILADLPDVEAILVGIGGGGLISGIATAVKTLKPGARVIGVEAAGAPSMRAALDAGEIVTLDHISTIADGIATKRAGAYTFAIARALVDDVVTVDDEEIIRAVLLLLERGKLLVEGAGAVGVAALLSERLRERLDLAGKRVVTVLTGGNIDMNLVGRFIQHGLAAQGRYLTLHTLLADRPGELLRLLALLAEQNVNVLEVEHHRTAPRLPIQQVEVVMTVETRDRAHCDALLALLRARGYAVEEEQPQFDLSVGEWGR